MLPESVALPGSRIRVAFQFGLDLRCHRIRRALPQAGLLQSLQEPFHIIFVRIPHAYILTDIFEVEKRRVVIAERLDRRASFLMAAQHAAGGRNHQVHPMELRHIDLLGGLQGCFVLAFAIVMVKKDSLIPAGMMAIEVHRPLHQGHAALPIAGEPNHDRHGSHGRAVARIERHDPLGGLAERGEIAAKEVKIRELFPAHLAGRINLDGAPRGLPRALGHRSIFANPCDADARERLNERVKYREAIRPLAPMATLEAAQDYFELEEGASDADYNAYNYMVLTARSKRTTSFPHPGRFTSMTSSQRGSI